MKNANTPRPFIGKFLSGLMALIGICTARADYQSTVLGDSPLAYYPLNLDVDTSGTATDVSGNGNPGTYVNIFPGFNNVTGPSPYITNGVSFDGLTTYVDLSTGSNPGLLNFGGPITLEAWVQPANPGASLNDIVAKGYDSSVDSSELQMRLNGGHYDGGAYNNTQGGRGAGGGTPTTNWTYVVCTFDGANWNMYLNSVRVGQGSDTTGALNFPTPWAIGSGTADGASRKFNGNISQVAIYNSGLSSNQVLNHYFRGKFNLDPNTSRPVITAQPQNQSTYIGGSVTFNVGVLSGSPTTNQWFKNGSPLSGKTNSSLVLNNVQSGDAVNYSVVVGNANGTTNSATASLSLFVPAQLRWLGTGNSGQWDTGSSPNWFNLSNSLQTVFNSGDQVFFTDVAGSPTNVAVASSVSPSLITVDSTTNYFFTGTGPITGTGGLIKKNSGTLTMLSGANMTGPVAIGGGTVYAGNFAFTAASSITVTNNATLDFGGADISGNKPVFVSGTGVNNIGALYNSSFETYGNVMSITLLGNATFGGSSRWDLANGTTLAGPYNLTLNRANSGVYGEWVSVSVGSDVGDILLATGKLGVKNMSSTFGNPAKLLTVNTNFELDFWNGGCNRTVRVLDNGKVQIFSSPDSFDGNLIFENNAQWYLYGGSGTQNLNGNVTFNGVAHFLLGDAHRAYSGVLSGTGGFVMDGWNHQMILSASNTYSGPTIIGDGPQVALTGSGSLTHSSLIFFGGNNALSVHLDVTGRSDGTLTLASGQTLGGIGWLSGNLTVAPGATLAPAGTNTTLGITTGQNTTGTIATTGDISLSGTTVLKLNGSGINDALTTTGGSIACGGTLNLVNISGSPLAAGNTFQLLNAAGSISGSFTITPATPGPGLTWDTTQLTIGIISVVGSSQPVISSMIVSGGNIILRGANGTTNGTFYQVTSTNVALPLSNWTTLSTNTFDANGAFSVTNPVSATTPKRFYRLKLP